MIEGFLFAMILSFGVSISENQNQQTNYGYFQEDYWEQNDVASMDWNHPLREVTGGGIVDDLNIDRVYESRNEENIKGRYFPKDEKNNVPPIEEKENKEEPLIAGIN